jgi:hypothetical protein
MRSPYKGSSRKLVLAFDIGTTYSGVCYALLDPGVVPEIKPVTTQGLLPLTSRVDLTADCMGRFLNNDWKDFKIPSVLYYYRRGGKFCGVGDPVQWDNVEKLNQVRW